MTRNYILYVLTLISSFLTCLIFVALMPYVSHIDTLTRITGHAAFLQFGLGSWLFLQWPKTGRWVAMILGLLLWIWLVSAIPGIISEQETSFYSLFGIPTILSTLVIYLHLKNWRNTERPGVLTRVLLALLPIGVLVYFFITESK